jgi:hypothetical protein
MQQNKNLTHQRHTPTYHIAPHPTANPFEEVAMDLITQLPKNGPHDAILTIVDHRCTRAALFLPCSTTITGEGIAELYLRNVYQWFGIPKKVFTDRDPRFTLHFATALCQRLKTKQNISTAYHPQTDGLSERKNQWVEQFLRFVTTAQQDNWSDWLPIASLVHNSRINATIKIAPLQALLGYLPQLIPEATPLLSNQRVETHGEEMAKQREQAQAALAKTAQGAPIEQFQTGDQVWLKARHLALPYQVPKLAPKRHGPFTITKQVSLVAYKLDLPMGWTIHDVFHTSLLTPYHETTMHRPNYMRPPPDLIVGEKEYEVENIINHCFHGRQRALQYLVHWKGYPDVDNLWEPAGQVHAPLLVAKYHHQNPLGEAQPHKNPRKQWKTAIRFTLLPTQQCPLPPSIVSLSPSPKHNRPSLENQISPQQPGKPSKSFRPRTPSSPTKSWTKSRPSNSQRSPLSRTMWSSSKTRTMRSMPRNCVSSWNPFASHFPTSSPLAPPSPPSQTPTSRTCKSSRLLSPLPTPPTRITKTSPTRLSCMKKQSPASRRKHATPLQPQTPPMATSPTTTSPPTSPSQEEGDASSWPPSFVNAQGTLPTSSGPWELRTTTRNTSVPSTLPLVTPTAVPSQPCPPGSSTSSIVRPPMPNPLSRPPPIQVIGGWAPTSTTTPRKARYSPSSTGRRTVSLLTSRPCMRTRSMSVTASNELRPL